ncbi:hypothetical protein PVAG01_10242 [Phlyctema vagabunda]|uniref:Prolyl oligopeptidase n=1 Tax=Phlyctema vagabunda TaxID=108571 RepID=A0ABR4P5H1_9HELO
MLPPPTLTFTIPSIHDNTVLDCRIYHPLRLNPNTVSQVSAPWEKKAALIAHPYAPLGGSYDDPVVDVIAATILKEGFIVGTFNFRGAGSSKGRTSWSSKPEQGDYVSMVGFLSYYLHHLSVPSLRTLPRDHSNFTHEKTFKQSPPSSPTKTRLPHPINTSLTPNGIFAHESDTKPLVLLAGYSYGGLVTSSIPPISDESVLPVFSSPRMGSAHAEIRLRALNLATKDNELLHTRFDALLSEPKSPNPRGRSTIKIDYNVGSPSGIPKAIGGVRMGGEEDLRRSSHETPHRGSFTIEAPERVRRSMDRVRSMARANRFIKKRENSFSSIASSRGEAAESASSLDTFKAQTIGEKSQDEPEMLERVPEIMGSLHVAYLLISPPHGLLGTLATLFTSKPLWAKGREKDFVVDEELRFTTNPTLTMFCHDDAMISVRRLRAWSIRLSRVPDSQFKYVEVNGGGHFWHDQDAIRRLRSEVKEFIKKL